MITTSSVESSENFEKHLTVSHENMSAIDLLAQHTDFSRQKLKHIMQQGAVWLTENQSTRRLRRASRKLKIGQILHLYYNASILSQTNFNARLIADEGDYSVWFKPSGMLSQGSKYGDHSAIYRWVETHLQPQRNAFLVHRLDRATSGLILIAHSKKAAVILSEMFQQRTIDKYYQALVHGRPVAPQTINEPLEGKKAITRILSISTREKPLTESPFSLLDIQILTGRKHQIRQHLKHIGHPIAGDRLYGYGEKDNIDLCLTAYKMIFISPFTQDKAQQKKHYELGSEFYPTDNMTNQNRVNHEES